MNPHSIPEDSLFTYAGGSVVKDALPAGSTQPEAAAIWALPPEILALVFGRATQDRPLTVGSVSRRKRTRTSPLVLGSVCSHWRQVAWSTPLLWTYIDPVPIRQSIQHSDAALLRLYFKNAHAHPVSLHIKLDRLPCSPSAASEEVIRAAFLENSHNICALILSSKSSLDQQWAMLSPKVAQSHFPRLQRLQISTPFVPVSRFDSPIFAHAPNLSQVFFCNYCPPHETFWEQITVLKLSSLPVNQCLESLIHCHNLVVFNCTTPRPSREFIHSAMNRHSPVTFQHLRKFEWVGLLADWDIFLYTYIRLPNLTHLILGNSHRLSRSRDSTVPSSVTGAQNTDPDLWKSFLRHIKNLTTLECTVFHSAQEWLDIFDIFSSTVHTLRFTAFNDAPQTIRLLQALPIRYGGFATRNYFPNLRSLSVTLDLFRDRSKHILDILRSRCIRPFPAISPTSDVASLDLSVDSVSKRSSRSALLTSPSTSSLLALRPGATSDHPINTVVDHDYWSSNVRLEDAIIICWPFGIDFVEEEREIARSLKERGLNLRVVKQSRPVNWL